MEHKLKKVVEQLAYLAGLAYTFGDVQLTQQNSMVLNLLVETRAEA